MRSRRGCGAAPIHVLHDRSARASRTLDIDAGRSALARANLTGNQGDRVTALAGARHSWGSLAPGRMRAAVRLDEVMGRPGPDVGRNT